MELEAIVTRLRDLSDDVSLETVRRWKEQHPGAPLVGYLPAYAPRELIYAAGGLAVGLWGGGIGVEIIHGDAFYQSYICHLPRSVIELAKRGAYSVLDGIIFPSICDVVRNLSGMWQILFPQQWVQYLDLPQNFDREIGGRFYRTQLENLAHHICGLPPNAAYRKNVQKAIRECNEQRRVLRQLMERRAGRPHLYPVDEYYFCFRSALVLPPGVHTQLVDDYMKACERRRLPERDNIRVLLVGAFCEQPPIGLLRSIEQAGCYIVNHDLLLGLHWFVKDIPENGDPFSALSDALFDNTRSAPFKFQSPAERAEELVAMIRQWRADGVIFAAPSFCDPSLLEQPILQEALAKEKIPYTSFRYAENTGQYRPIREQAGTFSDSIRLWGKEALYEQD
jgi:benzoyl-CoA reductase subunit C